MHRYIVYLLTCIDGFIPRQLFEFHGSHGLVESTTRTNKAAWLEFEEDDVVESIEKRIATLTHTTPEQGENLQVCK
jgi:hypothetical protein